MLDLALDRSNGSSAVTMTNGDPDTTPTSLQETTGSDVLQDRGTDIKSTPDPGGGEAEVALDISPITTTRDVIEKSSTVDKSGRSPSRSSSSSPTSSSSSGSENDQNTGTSTREDESLPEISDHNQQQHDQCDEALDAGPPLSFTTVTTDCHQIPIDTTTKDSNNTPCDRSINVLPPHLPLPPPAPQPSPPEETASRLPFPEISGEELISTRKIASGEVYLTNYRIVIVTTVTRTQIPQQPLPVYSSSSATSTQEPHSTPLENIEPVLTTTENGLSSETPHEKSEENGSTNGFTPSNRINNDDEPMMIQDRDVQNIPLGLVESIELRGSELALALVAIHTKTVRSHVIKFQQYDTAVEWIKSTQESVSSLLKYDNLFCFKFFKAMLPFCLNAENKLISTNNGLPNSVGLGSDMVLKDLVRTGLTNPSNGWRLTESNEQYKLCPSYPSGNLVVPAMITDEELSVVVSFRYSKRLPVVVWRSVHNGCVISRSSQPAVGWFGWRSAVDEKLLAAILATSMGLDSLDALNALNNQVQQDKTPSISFSVSNSEEVTTSRLEKSSSELPASQLQQQPQKLKKLFVLDARSYAAAVANRAKGGGCECPEYYAHCDVSFMSLANIHAIRRSIQALRNLADSPNEQAYWVAVENSKWLTYIAGIIKSAYLVVQAIAEEQRSVLVHCSDGWDRTPQIVSLAELMLDPFYRTIDGFQVLIQKEWLEFGHKFTDRTGIGITSDDPNERSPVFLQFLDCVHQLMRQFPNAFQFNSLYLVKILHHAYSGMFGTFIGNNMQERFVQSIPERTHSLWSYLCDSRRIFINKSYEATQQVLKPRVKDMMFWSEVYGPQQLSASLRDTDYLDELYRPKVMSTPASTNSSVVDHSGGDLDPVIGGLADDPLAGPSTPADSESSIPSDGDSRLMLGGRFKRRSKYATYASTRKGGSSQMGGTSSNASMVGGLPIRRNSSSAKSIQIRRQRENARLILQLRKRNLQLERKLHAQNSQLTYVVNLCKNIANLTTLSVPAVDESTPAADRASRSQPPLQPPQPFIPANGDIDHLPTSNLSPVDVDFRKLVSQILSLNLSMDSSLNALNTNPLINHHHQHAAAENTETEIDDENRETTTMAEEEEETDLHGGGNLTTDLDN